jgi:cob(I)alamin adenosyltransferase
MDMNKIQMDLADATADLTFGRNKEKHLFIIESDLKQISDYLDKNQHDANNVEHTLPMILGYMLYRLKEKASS